jgi:hypothetical protein
MTETSMPEIDASGKGGWTGGGGGVVGGGVHRVELVRTITSVKNHPCTGVLHRKTNGVKFNSNGILTSKTTNGNKIFN